MIHRPFSTAMVDLLLGTVVLLMLLINPAEVTTQDRAYGDYKLEMDWRDDANVDIDLYLYMYPNGQTVWFGWKSRDGAYSTRDDLGFHQGDDNVETIWLQSPLPGRYCTTIHNYSIGENVRQEKIIKGDVTVRITDDNANLLYKYTVPMPMWKEEVPMFCFTITENNQVKHFERSDLYIRRDGLQERESGEE